MEEARGDAGLSRLGQLQNRLYDRMRHPQARRAPADVRPAGGFDALRGHKYGLLVTFRKNGEPVPTPIWFGLADGRLYVRTGSEAGKVKRIRANPRVLVAPCTVRGKPLGPSVEGTARVLPKAEEAPAERAIQGNYGLGRRVYEGTAGAVAGEMVYIEVAPAGHSDPMEAAA